MWSKNRLFKVLRAFYGVWRILPEFRTNTKWIHQSYRYLQRTFSAIISFNLNRILCCNYSLENRIIKTKHGVLDRWSLVAAQQLYRKLLWELSVILLCCIKQPIFFKSLLFIYISVWCSDILYSLHYAKRAAKSAFN